MLTTFEPDTSTGMWIGTQILFGAGCGIVSCLLPIFRSSLTPEQGLQIPLIAIQRVLPERQVPEGTSIVIFIQTFGGSILIAVAQSVFNNKLVTNITARGIPVSPSALLSQGATQISQLVDPQYLAPLKSAYNESITQVSLNPF